MRVRNQYMGGEILRNRWAKAALAAAVVASVAASAPFAAAASNVYTWNNAGSDFNTPGDWDFNGSVSTIYPGVQGGGLNTDVADFNTLGTQPNLSASDSLGELQFDTAGWTLNGNPGAVLTLNGGTNDATNAGLTVGILSTPTSGINTIGVGLDIAAAQTWEVGTGGTLNVTGPVTDTNALTIGAAGFTGTVNFSQQITYAGELTAAGSGVTFSSGWAPASPYAGVAVQVTNNGSVTFGGTTTLTTTNANTSPGGYILDNLSGTTTVDGGGTLNLSVAADSNGSANEHVYVYNGPGATITNNGTLNVTGRPAFLLDANSAINDNGAMSFGPASGATSGFLLLQMGNGAVLNVGSAANSGASFSVTEPAGMVVESFGTGTGVGSINVYGTFSANASSPASPTSPLLRLGTDFAGSQDVMTVYSAASGGAPGNVTLNSVALGDNSTGSALTTPTLGAIYLQGGTTLNFKSTGTGVGVFSIGAAGAGTPAGTAGGGGQNNDFGYVFVGPNATIGVGGASNAPGQIDIGGQLRTATAVGGGNGVMDVFGGTVNVGKLITLAGSTVDQQFGALNVVGGTITISQGNGVGAFLTMSGGPTTASAGIYGSYSVVNVINSTLGVTGTNDDINLAGSSAGAAGVNPVAIELLPTGILNINASGGSSSTVKTGYVRAGNVRITVGGNTYSGNASGFVNFNGGTLSNNGGSSTLLFQSVAGYYVYNGGVTIAGVGDTSNAALYAPTGAGIPTGTISSGSITGGSGYVAPPIVLISDPTGFDASGYATVANGQVTSVVITNPGFNMSNPTIQLVGGGGSGASVTLPSLVTNASGPLTVNVNAGTTFTLTGNFTGSNGNSGTAAIYSLTNSNGSDNYNITGTSNTLGVDTSGSKLGNNPYANGTYYGFTYPGIRNNTSTYTGPTVIQAGTLALSAPASSATSGNPNNYAAGVFAAANNNIPFSSAIIVGDTATASAAALNITNIAGTGGFQLAPGLINSATYNGTTYSYTSPPQVLAGFGIVVGNSTHGLTVGLAGGSVTATATGTTSTGNNFGGYAFANGSTNNGGVITPTVNNSIISPGYTSNGTARVLLNNSAEYQPNSPYGTIVVGTLMGTTTISFNTQQGNAKSGPSMATGALTIGGGTSTPTTFGAGGTYYWKLDLTNGGAGGTATPGTATVIPGASGGAPAAGAAWDQLNLDILTVGSTVGANVGTGTTNAFTIQAVSFSSGALIQGGGPVITGGTSPYSWVIARVGGTYNASSAQSLLAGLSLDTNGLPAAASGWQYFLSAQGDPFNGGTDVVVNYAPAPEPTGLALFGLGAGAMLVRRRRA